MIEAIKFLSFVVVVAPVFAGEPVYDDHHHHHHHSLGYRTYSPAVLAKSAPLLVSKRAPLAYSHDHGHGHLHAHTHAYAHPHLHGHAHHSHAAPVTYVSGGVGLPAAYAYSVPSAEHVALLSTAGKPKIYGQSIPAAAIRNIETVMVTKTITPVVTKTTTHHSHAEPALSLGKVEGYSQNAVGHPKIAPVQFNTQYTSFANPTVGVNGPVIYSGPAVGLATGALVTKSAVAAQPVLKTAITPAYAVYPGLSLGSYGYDAHSVPAANFLELRSGKPVFSSPAYAYGHK